jgi:hypothetical protein
MFVGVLAGLFVLGIAAGAAAGVPDPDLSTVVLGPAAGMATCPAGDGPAFEYLTVTAKRVDDSPIAGIPYTSIFFTATGGDVSILHVGEETDGNGEIAFTVVGNETIIGDITVEAQIYTVALNDSDTLSCNSFDINEDGTVGVQDATLFVADYGTTAQRSDFNWDGTVGVQDATLFVAHYGH